MSDLKTAREKAEPALARIKSACDAGNPVGLTVDQAAAILAFVRALDSALPSTGPSSDLETTCGGCDGKGCDECDGAGTLPTAAGQRVLDLVDRHRLREG